MKIPSMENLRFDDRGLIPAVVQDAESGAVLMLAYMNRESLARTFETGETHFWSRSRNTLWHKGETSGNFQTVRSIRHDCDADALLVKVDQKGQACHTGEYSCFFTPLGEEGAGAAGFGEVMGNLARVIHQRNLERPKDSYTVKMLDGGIDRILKKVGEEAGEVIIAAKNHRPEEISWEVADLLYHTLVMLESEGVSLSLIAGELEKRVGQRRHDK
jgi:phosphoribosyl-ATP pyrophosphohydrolase/phosphoribosyl-AMP cyclohydrolase